MDIDNILVFDGWVVDWVDGFICFVFVKCFWNIKIWMVYNCLLGCYNMFCDWFVWVVGDV